MASEGQYAPVDDLVERFLEEEASVQVPGLDPLERARFHQLVRHAVKNWVTHSAATLRVTRGKYGMSLLFEGPVGGKQIAVFALRANHKGGDYRFEGPNRDRRRLGLPDEALESLERLRALYEAVLGAKDGGGEAITAVVGGASHRADLVPLVEETRRTLDGGSETGGSLPTPGDENRKARKRKKKKAPEGAEEAAPGAASPETAATASPSPSKSVEAPTEPPIDHRAFPGSIILAARDPAAVAAFYGRVLKLKPETVLERDGWMRVLIGGGFEILVRPDLSREERKQLGYGQGDKNRGWGSSLVLRVNDFDLCLRRSRRLGDAVVDEDLPTRRFRVRDPAGYLTEIHEA